MIASSWKKDNDRNASTFFITVHQLHFAKQRKNKCVYAPRPGKRTIRACEVFAKIKDTLLSFQVVPVVVHVILQYRFLSLLEI